MGSFLLLCELRTGGSPGGVAGGGGRGLGIIRSVKPVFPGDLCPGTQQLLSAVQDAVLSPQTASWTPRWFRHEHLGTPEPEPQSKGQRQGQQAVGPGKNQEPGSGELHTWKRQLLDQEASRLLPFLFDWLLQAERKTGSQH